jgi:putative acetyltransferase
MRLREYRDEDREATRSVFERAVHQSASADYSPDQLEAWAPSITAAADLLEWASARSEAVTVIAVEEGHVAGFGDLVEGSVLDMLYVDPAFARRGIATALIDRLCRLAAQGGAKTIETDASITARSVFERHGFVVLEEQTPVVRGIAMTNFRMRRLLGEGAALHRGRGVLLPRPCPAQLPAAGHRAPRPGS